MKVLYLGLTPPLSTANREIIHCPLIRIVPIESPDIRELSNCSHVIFTSKTAVHLLFQWVDSSLEDKRVFCVGRATAMTAEQYGVKVAHVASPETAEGIVLAFEQEQLEMARVFWPRAAGARPVINDFFEQRKIPLTDCVLYHTAFVTPSHPPDIEDIDEIVFTSPSTVDAFLALYGVFPQDKILTVQGPITQQKITAHAATKTNNAIPLRARIFPAMEQPCKAVL